MKKFKSILLSSLAFAPLSQLTHAQDSQTVKIQNSLTTALQQVDTDGEFLQIEKASDLIKRLAKGADKYFLPVIREKESDFPAGFSFSQALNMTGLLDITAGSKSVKKYGDNYLTKSFIQTNGSRKGILSLLGKTDQPWASLEYAPADTALLLETHLDLTNVPTIMRQLAPLVGEEIAAQMLAPLSEKEPVAGFTLEQVLAQADTRISIIAELDKTKTWTENGVTLPAIHATGRIDGIAKFLWENYGQTIAQALPVQSKGNVHTIISPMPVDSPWGQLTPALVIDPDKNHIWFSLSAEYLATCREGKTKLTDNKDFQLVDQHNSKTGAARLYLSNQITSLASDLLMKSMDKEMNDEPQAKEIFHAFFTYAKSLSSISSCVSHDDKGMHIHTNAPFPLKSNNALNQTYYVAALAGLSYAPIQKQLNAADRIEDISNIRSISIALLNYYAANNANYPDNLQQLVAKDFITEDFFELNNRELHYVKGLDARDGHKIILYTSADDKGKAIYGLVDGSVQAVDEKELKELLKKQK